MNVILYSTNCPKCNVLETKLKQKNIEHEICTDIDLMQSKGMLTAPNLEVDGKLMDFSAAVKWVAEYGESAKDDPEQYHCADGECSF